MENLNTTIENINLEETQLDEVLETTVEEITESNNTALIALVITATIGAGIYGYRKFSKWRKSKKESIEEPVEYCEEEQMDIEESEDNI